MSVELLNRVGGTLLWVNRVTRSVRSNGAPVRFNFQIWLRYAALRRFIQSHEQRVASPRCRGSLRPPSRSASVLVVNSRQSSHPFGEMESG
jgi:hypothetical protein